VPRSPAVLEEYAAESQQTGTLPVAHLPENYTTEILCFLYIGANAVYSAVSIRTRRTAGKAASAGTGNHFS